VKLNNIIYLLITIVVIKEHNKYFGRTSIESLDEFFSTSSHGFWYINLALTVRKGDVDGLAGNGLAVAIWVEDVADLGAIAPVYVRN